MKRELSQNWATNRFNYPQLKIIMKLLLESGQSIIINDAKIRNIAKILAITTTKNGNFYEQVLALKYIGTEGVG